MQQVLFHLGPVPIFGYGAMLFVAFVSCTLLAGWLCQREGINPQPIQDLAIWIFLCGIIGARLTFMIQYEQFQGRTFVESLLLFGKIWEGGLVFYGSMIGGVVGYCLAYFFVLRKQQVSSWRMADVIAPCVALGLALGRVGCLLNGCCYGNVACPDCMGIRFPLSAPPRYKLVPLGYQTAAGFTLRENSITVGSVSPGSSAEGAGLQPGDVIRKVNDKDVNNFIELRGYLANEQEWPRGKNDLVLTVRRSAAGAPPQDVTLPEFAPRTLRLYPTQVFESISMVLLMIVMLLYWPFRRRDGELMVIFMLIYAIHRFLDEMLRDDTLPVLGTGMTLSENGSILLFVAGLVVLIWVWRRPVQYQLKPASV